MSAYVTNTYPKEPILGKDFILAYPNILITILKKECNSLYNVNSFSKIGNITTAKNKENKFFIKFKDSFTTERNKFGMGPAMEGLE
ncbi:hypothetical protein COBT_002251 [Conglomerata obtusa]